MRTIEIREKLIHEINLSNNKSLLEELYHFLSQENKIQKPYKLTNEENALVEEARTQIKKGDYLTNEKANQEVDEWLNK